MATRLGSNCGYKPNICLRAETCVTLRPDRASRSAARSGTISSASAAGLSTLLSCHACGCRNRRRDRFEGRTLASRPHTPTPITDPAPLVLFDNYNHQVPAFEWAGIFHACFLHPFGASSAGDQETANSNPSTVPDRRARRTACASATVAESIRSRSRRAARGDARILHPRVLPQARDQPRTFLQLIEKWRCAHSDAGGPKDPRQRQSGGRMAPPDGKPSAGRESQMSTSAQKDT